MPGKRPFGIVLAAAFMILAGGAEIATAITHRFFSLFTSAGTAAVGAGIVIGALYLLAGVFVLPMRRSMAALALICLAFDVAGRVWIFASGIYPMSGFQQVLAMIVGTAIVCLLGIYVGLRWSAFQ